MSPGAARIGLDRARITGGFWKERIDTILDVTLERQWLALNDLLPAATPSHSVMNFRVAAGEVEGEFRGTMWQDSDVAKWLEAASYCLVARPDPALAARVEELIALVEKAQWPDGYLNTWFSLNAPEKRWTDLVWGHELYCAGHFIEAAVAHHEATGSGRLLAVGTRLADCVDREFGPGEGQNKGLCGHPEIELALFRLFRATRETRYRDLAIHFLETRGRDPSLFADKEPLGFSMPKTKAFAPDYFLARAPLRGQAGAEGHAVRAMYLYAALTEECLATGDHELRETLDGLWASVVGRRMYITGALGSQAQGERFTIDWDLPPDRAYGETCASIGFAFWAARMSEIEANSMYADVLERVAYNAVLAGLSREGTRYFYVNPLEVVPELVSARMDLEHVATARMEWLGCACCPPNIARFVASFASNVYGVSGDSVYVHQYAASEVSIDIGGRRAHLVQSTEYPWKGAVEFALVFDGPDIELDLALRVPSWTRAWTCRLNGVAQDFPVRDDGYLHLRRPWSIQDRLSLVFPMPLRFVRADSRVRDLAGRLAMQRGPLVLCAEALDNGQGLHELLVDPRDACREIDVPELGADVVAVEVEGYREGGSGKKETGLPLYHDAAREGPEPARTKIRALPYYLWGNRAPGGEMRIWLRGREGRRP